MNRSKNFAFAFALLLAVAINSGASALGQESPQKIALLVGVADYESENVTDLKYTENDVRVVGSQLKLMGFDVTSLTGSDATREKTIATIDGFIEKASELESTDIVFVMFSGHGQQLRVRTKTTDGSKVEEVPFFCPVDSVHFDESKITTRGKSESEIGEELNFVSLNRVLRGMDESSNSLNNLLVVDACRNNPSKGKSTGISGTSATVPRGVNILFAAGSGQKSWESADEKIKHGVFTHFLIKGLQGSAKNSRGMVTWSRLASYLQEEVMFSGPALAGSKDRVQNPHSIINSSNMIVLGATVKPKTVSAGNWTRFRGENGQGKIANSNIPLEWSETENIRWKYKLPGPGASSPIIFDGQVFVTAFSGLDNAGNGERRRGRERQLDLSGLKRHLVAVDLESGEQNWAVTVDGAADEQEAHSAHGYSSHTPVTDGTNVYAYFGYSGMHAYDLKGQEIWSRQFETTEVKNSNRFGSGGSSIVFEDLVIVNSGHETHKIHALDSETGETKWIFEDEALGNTNSTPVVVRAGDRIEMVMHLMGKSVGVDPRTGLKNWEREMAGFQVRQTASPVLAADNLVFSKSRHSMFAFKDALSNETQSDKAVWTNSKTSPASTPIETEDALLCFDDSKGILTVLNKRTGEKVDQRRLKNLSDKRSGAITSKRSFSSPILVGSNVIAVLGMGDALVIAKEGEFYETKFINRLGDEEETFLATPAVTGNELLIRSDKYLYCISKD